MKYPLLSSAALMEPQTRLHEYRPKRPPSIPAANSKYRVKPRRAMLAQIAEQKKTITDLDQENQRLNVYLKLLKQFERRGRVEVLRQEPDAK
jgi:hypothetical protein